MDEARLDYLAGMKYKDIAEKYNVALSTVKSWKTRNGWQRTKKAKKSTRTKTKSMRTKIEKVARSRSPDILEELADNDELTDKQKVFCMYYLQRYNATWAYQKAYGGSYERAGNAVLLPWRRKYRGFYQDWKRVGHCKCGRIKKACIAWEKFVF